jgi:hypothetical protein
MTDGTCPLCNQPAQHLALMETNDAVDPLRHRWKCEACGTFRISDRAVMELARSGSPVAGKHHLLSAYAKEGADVLIDLDLLDRLGRGGLRERTVPEKVELILRWFGRQSSEYGQEVVHQACYAYPSGWCRSQHEWSKLVGMLVRERDHLRAGSSGSVCSVTIKGWEWLGARPEEAATTAFVAMNFAPEYEGLRRAIEQGIGSAGYAPVVVSADLYAGGVMDRVLARIREARFVVADYTGNRGGVYYEAGFALGLGKLVIHSCLQEQLDSTDKTTALHFDVKHLKILPWRPDELQNYAEDLENHIEALLGRGPVEATASEGRP